MEDLKGWLILILIFGGPAFVISLLFHLTGIGLRKLFKFERETPQVLDAREERTALVRQWAHDQRHGGPLKGTPRPLTLAQEETAKKLAEQKHSTPDVIG